MTIVLSCLGMVAFAQTEAQQELKTYMDRGLVKWTSDNGLYSFRVGGRVSFDAGHYFDDYTDRGSGASISSARIRLFSKIGNRLDFKFDVDFAPNAVQLKDIYLRWHTNKYGFLRVGNFVEPFSYENMQSTFDDHLINKSATLEALGTGRTLGVSYRYYHPYFWGEAGAFSQRYDSGGSKGDKGYGFSTRLLLRYQGSDFHIHAGGSLNFRRPDANGYVNGSDNYNRYVTITSPLESSIDKTPILGGQIQNAKNQTRYGVELMASFRQFYISGEYISSTVKRERDWEYMFQEAQGTMMGPWTPTVEDLKEMYGGDPDVKVGGYSIQAGWKIIGGDYRYNKVDALMERAGRGSLELVLRYNHTNLNDIVPGSIFFNGGFYDNMMMASWWLSNGSFAGGKVHAFTVGLNYYFTDNLLIKVNYGYQKLDHQYNLTYLQDKNLHSIQARLAFEF